jgi:ABC-type multidrug transport system ATPase subunit
VQNHLGAFGFSGDEVFREIGSLSGGERARMALALMTLSRANLLVLDEPTNHLDVENIEALEDALEEYEGTVLLVSHDRAFLREVATRVWWFDGNRLVDFDGPFVEWEKRAAEDAEAAVQRLEKRVTELEVSLEDTDLYDGSAEGAQKAARLDQELAKARQELDAAMVAWAEAAG